MIAGELEDVGVHHENEQVAGETDLELEIASVGELKNKVAAFLAIFLLKGGDNGARGVAEKLERSFGGLVYVFFQFSLGEDEVAQLLFDFHAKNGI